MQRRSLLRRVAGIAIVGLAGCGGDDGATTTPTATETETNGESGGGTPMGEPTATPTAMSESPTTSDTPTQSPEEMSTETPTAEPTPLPTATATSTQTPTETSSPTFQADQVVQVGPGGEFQFSPESFTIEAGSTVVWTWDSANHNVRPESTPEDSSWEGTPGGDGDTYNSGYTHEHEFTVPGEYEYYCGPHRGLGMTGSFTVE